MDEIQVDDLIWYESTMRHITRHGGSMRRCREVKEGAPKFFDQERSIERRGTHQVIGPENGGRLWTVIIEYRGDGEAAPLSMWSSRPSQIRKYRNEPEGEKES